MINARSPALFLLLLFLGIAPSAAQSPGDPEAGRALALRVCANCHLVAEGQRQAAMDSVPSFDALARDPAMTEARLQGFLNRPHPPMPDPQLSRQDVADLLVYFESRRRAAR